jgi:spermidine synthase
MEKRADGTTWFAEYGQMWPGQAMTLKVDKVLEDFKSEYQHVIVADTATYGKLLVLDGAIQVTDRDEFSYHEMIAHLPLMSHARPERVLIIGGGDGGALNQVLRHPSVQTVHLCDIDKSVTEVSKRHFPKFAPAWTDARAEVHHADGAAFIAANPGFYDVVIVDSSDPIGPAEALFEAPFYRAIAAALRPGGVVCTQGECVWLHKELIAGMVAFCRSLYEEVGYAWTSMPTYPSGSIGFIICRKAGGDAQGSVPA